MPNADTTKRYRYRLFGLVLASDLPLPELEPCEAEHEDAVEIVLRPVDALLDGGDTQHALRVVDDGAVLGVSGTARFHIGGGRLIAVDPDPAASARNVRLFLLGSAMGVLLHQRGLVPLHANAVEFAGRAVAFMGHSGAGKSTLAAAFHDRGGRVLSDDVCVLTPERNGFVVQPGIPRLRLWRDAVERSGRATDGYERAFDALDKYTIGTNSAARAEAMPLGAIYLLRQGEADAPLAIRRLSGVEAAQALIENTYRGAFIQMVGNQSAYFQTCLAIHRAVPVFELIRPWNSARIDETFAQIEAHLHETMT